MILFLQRSHDTNWLNWDIHSITKGNSSCQRAKEGWHPEEVTVYRRATERQAIIQTHMYTYRLLRVPNSLFRLWEGGREPTFQIFYKEKTFLTMPLYSIMRRFTSTSNSWEWPHASPFTTPHPSPPGSSLMVLAGWQLAHGKRAALAFAPHLAATAGSAPSLSFPQICQEPFWSARRC